MEIEELIRSVDIVEYISQFVEMTENNGEWWGCSPFKEENTPSFSVRDDPPFFYDFSSGKSGNVYTFVREYFKCSGKEAVEKLKKFVGMTDEQLSSRRKMNATVSCKKYTDKHVLKTKSKTEDVKKAPQNIMDKYEINNDKLGAWRAEGICDNSLRRFNVKYDPFSNRLVYPIYDISGKIVNVGGRALDKNWKELGQNKYCYFYKWGGAMNVLYGLYDNLEYIKDKHEIILFEGCKSVLIADTWGIKNTAAILTSHLSVTQMIILAKLGCNVIFALDKDVNILEDKNIKKLRKYVNISYIYDRDNLLKEKDSPVDRGKETFLKLYSSKKRM